MANAFTTTYNLTKPEVGASEDTWGGHLNANSDTLDDLLDGTTGITPNLIAGWEVAGVAVTATAAEFNVLDGITATVAELNILDGVTATAAELSLLDDVTAILQPDVSDNLTAGYSSDVEALGTISSGTVTPEVANAKENLKSLTNGGAFTLAIPATNGPISIQVTNNGSAGEITFAAGYQKVGGDTLTTTDGDDFFIHIIRIGAFASASIEALQ